MRLEGQKKGGFFPASNELVGEVCKLLTTPSTFSLLDPCCGEGEALKTLAYATGCPEVYGIELEDHRAVKAQALCGDGVLGPASFFDTRITRDTFGLAWVNPPFDDEAGGGQRVELNFLVRATDYIAPGGVLCFVVPETQVGGTWKSRELTQFFVERYENGVIVLPRDKHRPYREVVCIGTKRKRPIDWAKTGCAVPPMVRIEAVTQRWAVPVTGAPRQFVKIGYTDKELLEAVARSPHWRLTQEPQQIPPARPPLPISKGHIALLLASGECDGVVRPEGEEPHLVKGTAMKVKKEPEVTVDEDDNGNTKTITTIKEEIKLVIRAVTQSGEIRTFE
jgi:hypothetical protein